MAYFFVPPCTEQHSFYKSGKWEWTVTLSGTRPARRTLERSSREPCTQSPETKLRRRSLVLPQRLNWLPLQSSHDPVKQHVALHIFTHLLQRNVNYNVNVIRWGEWLWQRNVVKRYNKNVSREFLPIRVTHVTTNATGATRMTRVQGRHYSVDWGGHVHLTFSRRFLRLMQTRVSEWVEFNAPPDTI